MVQFKVPEQSSNVRKQVDRTQHQVLDRVLLDIRYNFGMVFSPAPYN